MADDAPYQNDSPFRRQADEPFLTRAMPVTTTLRYYSGRSARHDTMAGVTMATLPLPSAMAYSVLHPARPSGSSFDGEALTHVDTTGLDALRDRAGELGRDGITLLIARLRGLMEEQFEVSGLSEIIGPEHFHPTVRAAVEACTAGSGDRHG